MKISQFREGSFGRFSSHEGGIPVYSRADRRPEFCFGMGGRGGVEEDEEACGGEDMPVS